MGGCSASKHQHEGLQEAVRYHASCVSDIPDGAYNGVPLLEEEGDLGLGLCSHIMTQANLEATLAAHQFVVVVTLDHRPFSRSLFTKLVRLSLKNLGIDVKFAKYHHDSAMDPTAGEESVVFQEYPYNKVMCKSHMCKHRLPITRCYKDGVQCRPDVYGDHLEPIVRQLKMWKKGEVWLPPPEDVEFWGLYTETIKLHN